MVVRLDYFQPRAWFISIVAAISAIPMLVDNPREFVKPRLTLRDLFRIRVGLVIGFFHQALQNKVRPREKRMRDFSRIAAQYPRLSPRPVQPKRRFWFFGRRRWASRVGLSKPQVILLEPAILREPGVQALQIEGGRPQLVLIRGKKAEMRALLPETPTLWERPYGARRRRKRR